MKNLAIEKNSAIEINNEETQLQLIEALINPFVPCSGKCLRTRAAPTKIKSLYHLTQLQKNIKRGKWTSIYQGKTAISARAKVSKKHFSEFVNSDDFMIFGEIIRRPGTTNIYRLHPWVIDLFKFLEKKGMMKLFSKNFYEWKKTFLKRLHKWLLPLLRKGFSLDDIHLNKLSTKKDLKGEDPHHLKGDGIKPTGFSIKPNGIKTNNEDAELGVQEANEVSSILANRLHLRGADIHHFFFKNSVGLLKKAAEILCYRIEVLKWKPRSNVRALQSIINDLKKAA